jgi:hypothetical protein
MFRNDSSLRSAASISACCLDEQIEQVWGNCVLLTGCCFLVSHVSQPAPRFGWNGLCIEPLRWRSMGSAFHRSRDPVRSEEILETAWPPSFEFLLAPAFDVVNCDFGRHAERWSGRRCSFGTPWCCSKTLGYPLDRSEAQAGAGGDIAKRVASRFQASDFLLVDLLPRSRHYVCVRFCCEMSQKSEQVRRGIK